MIEQRPPSLQLRVVRDDAENSGFALGVVVVARSKTLVHRQIAAAAASTI